MNFSDCESVFSSFAMSFDMSFGIMFVRVCILPGSGTMFVYFCRRKVVKAVAIPIGDVCMLPLQSLTLLTIWEDWRLCCRITWYNVGCSSLMQYAGAMFCKDVPSF